MLKPTHPKTMSTPSVSDLHLAIYGSRVRARYSVNTEGWRELLEQLEESFLFYHDWIFVTNKRRRTGCRVLLLGSFK